MIWGIIGGVIWGILGLIVFIKLASSIRLVPTKKAYIVERLGKYHASLNPGFHLLFPFFDRVAYIQDLKEEAMDVPPQECFTKDNVNVEVDGVLYISVTNAVNASYGITNYRWAAIQLAQTTTRSVIGTLELDRTFEEREAISSRVVSVLNEVSESWGIKVHRYEVKNIVPPNSVRKSMEQQMGAERERRALLARSEGDKQSRVNESEGRKMELINRSEGEMRRRINEAEGQAQEILALAKATAESIEKMGAALSQPGGTEAVQLKLSQSYISQLSNLARPDKSVLLPADVSQFDQLLEGIGLGDFGANLPKVAPNVVAPKPASVQRQASPARVQPKPAAAPQLPAQPAPAQRLTAQPASSGTPSQPAPTQTMPAQPAPPKGPTTN